MVYIPKKQIMTRFKRYRELNETRLAHALSLMSHDARFCLSIVPVLLHYNHVNLPGYRSAGVPHGIDMFTPDERQRRFLQDTLAAGAPPLKEPRDKAILGLYAMGSTSSIGQSDSSDVDIWVCVKASLTPEQTAALQDKCRFVTKYIKSQGVELNLFVTPEDRFTNFQPDSLDEENCGSAQNLFLLDEFYRSSIRLCGRYIIWYLISTKEEQQAYEEYVNFLTQGVSGMEQFIAPAPASSHILVNNRSALNRVITCRDLSENREHFSAAAAPMLSVCPLVANNSLYISSISEHEGHVVHPSLLTSLHSSAMLDLRGGRAIDSSSQMVNFCGSMELAYPLTNQLIYASPVVTDCHVSSALGSVPSELNESHQGGLTVRAEASLKLHAAAVYGADAAGTGAGADAAGTGAGADAAATVAGADAAAAGAGADAAAAGAGADAAAAGAGADAAATGAAAAAAAGVDPAGDTGGDDAWAPSLEQVYELNKVELPDTQVAVDLDNDDLIDDEYFRQNGIPHYEGFLSLEEWIAQQRDGEMPLSFIRSDALMSRSSVYAPVFEDATAEAAAQRAAQQSSDSGFVRGLTDEALRQLTHLRELSSRSNNFIKKGIVSTLMRFGHGNKDSAVPAAADAATTQGSHAQAPGSDGDAAGRSGLVGGVGMAGGAGEGALRPELRDTAASSAVPSRAAAAAAAARGAKGEVTVSQVHSLWRRRRAVSDESAAAAAAAATAGSLTTSDLIMAYGPQASVHSLSEPEGADDLGSAETMQAAGAQPARASMAYARGSSSDYLSLNPAAQALLASMDNMITLESRDEEDSGEDGAARASRAAGSTRGQGKGAAGGAEAAAAGRSSMADRHDDGHYIVTVEGRAPSAGHAGGRFKSGNRSAEGAEPGMALSSNFLYAEDQSSRIHILKKADTSPFDISPVSHYQAHDEEHGASEYVNISPSAADSAHDSDPELLAALMQAEHELSRDELLASSEAADSTSAASRRARAHDRAAARLEKLRRMRRSSSAAADSQAMLQPRLQAQTSGSRRGSGALRHAAIFAPGASQAQAAAANAVADVTAAGAAAADVTAAGDAAADVTAAGAAAASAETTATQMLPETTVEIDAIITPGTGDYSIELTVESGQDGVGGVAAGAAGGVAGSVDGGAAMAYATSAAGHAGYVRAAHAAAPDEIRGSRQRAWYVEAEVSSADRSGSDEVLRAEDDYFGYALEDGTVHQWDEADRGGYHLERDGPGGSALELTVETGASAVDHGYEAAAGSASDGASGATADAAGAAEDGTASGPDGAGAESGSGMHTARSRGRRRNRTARRASVKMVRVARSLARNTSFTLSLHRFFPSQGEKNAQRESSTLSSPYAQDLMTGSVEGFSGNLSLSLDASRASRDGRENREGRDGRGDSEVRQEKAAGIERLAAAMGIAPVPFLNHAMPVEQLLAESQSIEDLDHYVDGKKKLASSAGAYPEWAYGSILSPKECEEEARRDNFHEFEAPLDVNEWFDFGSVVKSSPTEYFGSGLWLLYKAIDSPFKVVLKILLMEAYSNDYPDTNLLSSELKDYMLSHDGYSLDLDSYYLMYLKVSNYLQSIGHDSRLMLMRKCFYLKIFMGLNNKASYHREDFRLKRELLNKFSVRWGWSRQFVSELEQVATWKMEAVRAFDQEVYRTLLESYQSLLRFSVRHGIEYAITSDDAGILSRKLYAAFDRFPGKVMVINSSFSHNLEERNLTFISPAAHSLCRRGWHLYSASADDLALLNLKVSYIGARLSEVVTWAVFNGLLTARTITWVRGAPSAVNPLKINKLSHDIKRYLEPRRGAVSEQSLQRSVKLRGCLVVLNLEKDDTELLQNKIVDIDYSSTLCCGRQRSCLIGSIDLIAVNSWGELRTIALPNGEEGVVELLATLLRIMSNTTAVNSVKDMLELIEICSYAASYQDLIKYDLEGTVRQVFSCMTNDGSSEYVFDVGRNTYIARAQGERGVMINKKSVFGSSEYDISVLSRYGMRPEYALQVPPIVDRYATSGIVQYFFIPTNKGHWDIYIVNERNEVSTYRNYFGSRATLVNAINRFYTRQSEGRSGNSVRFNLPQYFVLNKDLDSIHPFTIRGSAG